MFSQSDSSGEDLTPDEHMPSNIKSDEAKRQAWKQKWKESRAHEYSEASDEKPLEEPGIKLKASIIETASKCASPWEASSSHHWADKTHITVKQGQDYLGSLDDFLDDNLRSIADLISIKKSMKTDIDMISAAQIKLNEAEKQANK